MNKKVLILLVFIALFYVFSGKSDNVELSHFYLKKSQDVNSGIPFNYFLSRRDDNAIVHFFVNDIFIDENHLYFSYIDGKLDDDFCYENNNLKLARIGKSAKQIEQIPIQSNEKIFNLINNISESDKKWLSDKLNQCK